MVLRSSTKAVSLSPLPTKAIVLILTFLSLFKLADLPQDGIVVGEVAVGQE